MVNLTNINLTNITINRSNPWNCYVTNKVVTFTSTKYTLLPFYIISTILIEALVSPIILKIIIIDGLKKYLFF